MIVVEKFFRGNWYRDVDVKEVLAVFLKWEGRGRVVHRAKCSVLWFLDSRISSEVLCGVCGGEEVRCTGL
ncbi:hypothetical protein M3J09_005642 [Ascochyta lentis]